MITFDAFFAESSSAASFGRRNFFGVNPGREIHIPAAPYHLKAVFIVLARIPANTPSVLLEASFSSSWGMTVDPISSPTREADHEVAALIEWSIPDLRLPEPGSTFSIRLTAGLATKTITWKVVSGQGPWRRALTGLPSVAVVDGRSSWTPLVELVQEVRHSLVVVDAYADPTFLRTFLPAAHSTWPTKVLVSQRTAARFRNDVSLTREFPGLAVRADDLFHDRFVLRDDEEVYAFGHSLKDLDKGRLSFFTRVYDEEQAELIRAAIPETWDRATAVL